MRTLRQAMIEAAERYLQKNKTRPEQFNIKKSKSEGWGAEFHPQQTNWSEGYTTWESDAEKVLDLFFTCDADEVDILPWDDEWTDE